jgi:hypothetical protein
MDRGTIMNKFYLIGFRYPLLPEYLKKNMGGYRDILYYKMTSHPSVSDVEVTKDLLDKGLWLDSEHWLPPSQIVSLVVVNSRLEEKNQDKK